MKVLKFSPKKDCRLQETFRTEYFKNKLEEYGYTVEIYSHPGQDIGASCGQFFCREFSA